MTTTKLILTGLLFGSAMLGVALLVDGVYGPGVYKDDKLVFTTESEYVLFKQALADNDVEIIDISVLSSEPPIIVSFRVSLPSGESFSYGQEVGIPWFVVVPLALLFGVVVSVGLDVL